MSLRLARSLPIAVALGAILGWSLGAVAQNAAEPLPLPPYSPTSIIPGLAGVITTSKQVDDVKAQARQLWGKGATVNRQGTPGEAWRLLEQARAMALGTPWTEREQYIASLVLRADTAVTDPARPLLVRLSQRYPAAYKLRSGLQLKLSLIAATTERKVVRDLGKIEGVRLDLIERPFGFSVDLQGIKAGRYHLVAELSDGEDSLGRVEASIWAVPDFDKNYADIRRRVAKVKGDEGTKARILYPFDLARVINSGIREPAFVDYSAEINRSKELLSNLEGGHDSLYRAVGDLKKAYLLSDAGEVMPYRVYVPKKWKAGEHLPMVVFLHGANSDENTAFEWPLGRNVAVRLDGAYARLAEERGFIAVAPLGYRVSANWGGASGFINQEAPNPHAGDVQPIPDPWDRRAYSLAEKDTLSVVDIVAKEYDADPHRIYLIGNSAGAGGTLYLAGKYPQRWAAIAPSALPYHALSFDPQRYKDLPVLLVHSENDPIANVANSRQLNEMMKTAGVDVSLTEVKGLDVAVAHNLPWIADLSEIFDFLARHTR